MPEGEEGTVDIGGRKIKTSTLLLAGGAAVVAFLLFRGGGGGGGGTSGFAIIQPPAGAAGEAGPIGPAGPPGPAANVTALEQELAKLTAWLNQFSQYEKQVTAGGYTTKVGDTWQTIAAKFNTTVEKLKSMNPHVARINPGQAIFVPLPPVPTFP